MQRVGSYFVAVIVIVAIVAAISWALMSEQPGAQGLQRSEGPYKFEATPVGYDGPLKRCVVCHSIESGGTLRVAPPLHGIVGARKARTEWYGYSPALRKAKGNWTEAELDKFLTSPSKFLPGTTKTLIGIADPEERADIIAALKKAP